MRIVRVIGLCAGLLSVPSLAHAETLAACGEFDFDPANVSCSVLFGGACELGCTPHQFFDECAGDLFPSCRTECTFEADIGCTGSCTASCEAECEVSGGIDCYAYCNGSCTADCDTFCSGDADEEQCHISCNATCEGECAAGCEVEPPQADCTASCSASCEGECHASANLECQADCQSQGALLCQAEHITGCKTQCRTLEGALFCNGDWVETEDLDACAQAIESTYSVEVSGYVESCTGDDCQANGCSAAGSASSPSSLHHVFGIGAALALAGAFAKRVRGRRENSA